MLRLITCGKVQTYFSTLKAPKLSEIFSDSVGAGEVIGTRRVVSSPPVYIVVEVHSWRKRRMGLVVVVVLVEEMMGVG